VPRRKAFVLLTALYPVTFAFCALPIALPLIDHIDTALHVSRLDPFIRANWWDWQWSWIAFCGPPGRYIVGAVLGFAMMKFDNELGIRLGHGMQYRGQLVHEPHLRFAVVVSLLGLIAIFSAVLAALDVRTILRGETNFEAKRRSGAIRGGQADAYICFPGRATSSPEKDNKEKGRGPKQAERNPTTAEAVHGRVIPVTHDPRPFDLGRRQNWANFKRGRIFPDPPGAAYEWARLNPDLLRKAR